MKYSELIQIESLDEVVQLCEASNKEKVQDLVKSFVFSPSMEKQFCERIIPAFSISNPVNNKGLFIVGNYGTGKSHLLSILMGVLEFADLLPLLRSETVINGIQHDDSNNTYGLNKEAGLFKIIRMELGGVSRSLRDLICNELEKGLSNMGITFSFPSEAEMEYPNHKPLLMSMMGEFEKIYPEKGLFLAVDELLNYLLSRNDNEIHKDLIFLKELGEVSKLSRFKIICGLQEALFDNPRFQFVSSTIQGLHGRYDQVRIVKEDLAFVVADRLLKKDERQKALIRAHLERFSPLYIGMGSRIEEYVELFPIHPSYIETLELMLLVEKRDVLRSISRDISYIADKDVPDQEPGLISFDHYWRHLKEDASLSTKQDVKEIINIGITLEGKISHSFPTPQYKDAAIRIVHALIVSRLTYIDLDANSGITAEEIRDDLALVIKNIPEGDPEFLLTIIERILNEIILLLSGEFVKFNNTNSQYYINRKGGIDYDVKINQRGKSLSNNHLDRYYFESLARLLERDDITYVPGFHIWEYELNWPDHQAGRQGYLFFGAPNQRSTAQPPRDFYIYFIQTFEPPKFSDSNQSDEVFFRLKKPDDEFESTLRQYGGARELSLISSGKEKQIYEQKAKGFLIKMVEWLQKNMGHAYELTYAGQHKTIVEWSKVSSVHIAPEVKITIDGLSAYCLSPYFKEQAPDYPKFSTIVNKNTRTELIRDAFGYLRGKKNQAGAKILDALFLLKDDRIDLSGKYASYFSTLLSSKDSGRVVNREEIIDTTTRVPYDLKFRLEPDLVMVVLGALAYSGDLVIVYPSKRVDAAEIEYLEKTCSPSEWDQFKHIERPVEPPIELIANLFEVLGLPPGLIKNPQTHHEAVVSMTDCVMKTVKMLVQLEQDLKSRPQIFGMKVPSDEKADRYSSEVIAGKLFLEKFQSINSIGKLKNISFARSDLDALKKSLAVKKIVEDYQKAGSLLTPFVSYLQRAEDLLPAEDPVAQNISKIRGEILNKIGTIDGFSDQMMVQEILKVLQDTQLEYIQHYMKLHTRARLNVKEDEKKKKILSDPRISAIRQLAPVVMYQQRERSVTSSLTGKLVTCFALKEQDLKNQPFCPHCNLRPADETGGASASMILEQVEEEIDSLADDLTSTLFDELSDPVVKGSLHLLDKEEGKLVETFLNTKKLPVPVDGAFVQAVSRALQGLELIEIHRSDLITTLLGTGSPVTSDEIGRRFTQFIQELLKGRDPQRVRLVIVDE